MGKTQNKNPNNPINPEALGPVFWKNLPKSRPSGSSALYL